MSCPCFYFANSTLFSVPRLLCPKTLKYYHLRVAILLLPVYPDVQILRQDWENFSDPSVNHVCFDVGGTFNAPVIPGMAVPPFPTSGSKP